MAEKEKTISTATRTGKPQKVDDKEFADIKSHADQLLRDDSKRDEFITQVDDAYLMRWDGGSGKKFSKAKLIQNPDPRNQALGAVRLLVATDPIFNITNATTDQNVTDKLEKAANRLWNVAGRAAGNPIHYDALLSSILYAEMHIAVTSTDDMVEAASKAGVGVARAERIAKITPFLIEAWNPKDGHAEFDRMGLSGYYRKTTTTVNQVLSDFGDRVPDALKTMKKYDPITLHTFYDLINTCIWTDQGPIMLEAHELPLIPVVVQQTEGSRLWTKPEESKQPLLYTLLKSGLWDMQNMIMTVMYTLIRDMGVTPLYEHNVPEQHAGKELVMDFDEAPGVVETVGAESFRPIENKGLLDPAVEKGLQLAQQKGQESTLYPQALGAPINGTSTYSELALLSQSGRLPLVGTQKRGGWGISQVIELCLAIMKHDNLSFNGNGMELNASEIPEYVQFDTKIDVKLPQDKLQMANIANILANGDDPLVSHEWALSEILNVNQAGDMQRQIWTEKAANMKFLEFLQQQAKAAQEANAMNVTTTPNQTGTQAAAPQMPGSEMQGGLPQAQAGIVAGAGQGVVGEGE